MRSLPSESQEALSLFYTRDEQSAIDSSLRTDIELRHGSRSDQCPRMCPHFVLIYYVPLATTQIIMSSVVPTIVGLRYEALKKCFQQALLMRAFL